MKHLLHDEFTGLNVQRVAALSDQKTSRVATNVYLTSAKKWRTRPGSKKRYALPAQTKGLYSAGGVLRSVAPAGDASIFNRQSPKLFFDFIDAAGGAPTKFINSQILGTHVAAGAQPYVALERGGQVEHHWFRNRPTVAGGDASNRVTLPFTPTGNIMRGAEKIWAINQPAGTVPYSSTQFGPDDWTALDDAGFLPALAHAPGTREMTALGLLQSTPGAANRRQGALVVFFADGAQVWAIDPDPLNHYITTILDGPGTENPRSVVNALGNPVFLSRQGFRSLRLAFQVGGMDSMTIGHPIEPLTEGLGADAVSAAIWWDRLGVYLAAVGSTLYCWRFDPLTKVSGWSTWEMPWEITDLVDFEGSLYVRTTDNGVYELNENFTTDDGAPVTFDVETQFLHAGTPGFDKEFGDMMVFQEGQSTIAYRPVASTPGIIQTVYSATGVTKISDRVPLHVATDSLALRFTGTGHWQLDGFTIDYSMAGA